MESRFQTCLSEAIEKALMIGGFQLTEWREWRLRAIFVWLLASVLVQAAGHALLSRFEPSALIYVARIALLVIALAQVFIMMSSLMARQQRMLHPDN